jgi:hypothetical protein
VFDKNEKIHKRSIKKIDAVVTGILLGGIVASIYGIKKTSEQKDEKEKNISNEKYTHLRKIMKMLVF